MTVSAGRGTAAKKSQQETQTWRRRDTLAAAFLFLCTAGFVLWQNSRVAVLWDLGYLLDTSWRMALGQIPYRDFPLVHPPLTFLAQATLMRMAGRHYWMTVAYGAAVGGLGTVITWRIVLRVLGAADGLWGGRWRMSLLLAAPLTVLGIYSVYPHPIYDGDCALTILLAVWMLLGAGSETGRRDGWFWPLAAGAACVLPVFEKQNMGLPFLLAVVITLGILLAADMGRGGKTFAGIDRRPAWMLAGVALALAIGISAIAIWAGLENYLRWTVQFAAQRRMPGMGAMLSVYQQPALLWMAPVLGLGLVLCHLKAIRRVWVRAAAVVLMAAPLVCCVMFLFLNDDADDRADSLLTLWPLWMLAATVIALFALRRGVTMARMMPLVVLAAVYGTFMSQQLWGSTYALWPMLMILVAAVLAEVPEGAGWVVMATAVTVSLTLLVCGGLYAVSLERLNYVRIPEASLQHSSSGALVGMANRGPYQANLDELVAYTAAKIPLGDALLVVPGEDPFYYATGRVPQFPVLLFDPGTDPYTADELLAEVRRRNVQWVIVKRVLQNAGNPIPDAERTQRLIEAEFSLDRRLAGYDIYRRR